MIYTIYLRSHVYVVQWGPDYFQSSVPFPTLHAAWHALVQDARDHGYTWVVIQYR